MAKNSNRPSVNSISRLVVSVRDSRVFCDCGLEMSGPGAMKASRRHMAESAECGRLVVEQVRVLVRTADGSHAQEEEK